MWLVISSASIWPLFLMLLQCSAFGFYRTAYIEAHTPEVESDDGSKVSPLYVSFTGGKGLHFDN